MLTDVGRIVAVPKAVPKTRGLSRAPAGVSGLGLVAGVSVAVSAEIQLSVDRARAMSSRISTRFAPASPPPGSGRTGVPGIRRAGRGAW
jgi:hypothetical protein